MFCKKGVLRNFERDSGTGFSCEFGEILSNNFSYGTPHVAPSRSSRCQWVAGDVDQ